MKTRHISRRFRRFLKANEAVSALEYAILVGVVTVAVGSAITIFSQDVIDAIAGIGDSVGTTAASVGGEQIADTPTTATP